MKSTGGGRVLSERLGRWMLNFFPPLFFNRIQVTHIAPGYRGALLRVRRSIFTRNLNGTTFGGTIFTAADPVYAVLYWQLFARRGERLQVWLKTARINYKRPAATTLTMSFAISEADIEAAVADLDRRGTALRNHRTEAHDTGGNVCAIIETEVYMRRPRGTQREVSGF